MQYTTEGAAEYVMTLFPKEFKGICVDIGAYDPMWINNSWIFEQAGWDTYCIEPNPKCIESLKKHRKNVLEYACSDGNRDDADFFVFTVSGVGEAAGSGLIDHCQGPAGEWHKTIFTRKEKVKVRTLDWLMENEIKQDHIDYLSIDVERAEMQVLRGVDLHKWKVKVIAIENLEHDQEQRDWLKNLNYRYVHRISYNDFYIFQEFYDEVS